MTLPPRRRRIFGDFTYPCKAGTYCPDYKRGLLAAPFAVPRVSPGGGGFSFDTPTLHPNTILGYDFVGETVADFRTAINAQWNEGAFGAATFGARDTDILLNGHATCRFGGAGGPALYAEKTIDSQPYLWLRSWQKSTLSASGASDGCDSGGFVCDVDYNGYIEPFWHTPTTLWSLGPFGDAPFTAADAGHSGRETWLAWRVRAVENDVKFFINGALHYDGPGSGSIAGITKVGINMAAQHAPDQLNFGHYEIVAGDPDPYGLL